MGARSGKHKRNDNESQFGHSATRRRGKHLNGKDEQNEVPSSTMMYDLPLEMLDIILQKSYLHWILNLSTKQRDEEVIRSLISVDVCFNRRITRQRFKKAIWRYLKDFYGKTQKRYAIIRNNRNYLLENIQPNGELIASLLSLNCITEEQSHVIQRHRSNREKNAELLYFMRSFGRTNFSNFVKCLRQTNQKTVARIIENGGALIKIEVQNYGAKSTMSMETQLLHQKLEDLRDRTKPRSYQTDKLVSQLREEGIEILNSQLDRQTVVIWIWCHLQAALEHIQKLYRSNQLIYMFFENIQPSISKVINIDGNQFKKTIVVSLISVNFTRRIAIRGNVWGVTKLRNEIYVLCQSDAPCAILVFEDRNAFRLRKVIEIKEIKSPWDIASSQKEQCLYISDFEEKCVWKITRETVDQHKIIKWLTIDYQPLTLSVSSDGRLLMVNDSSSILMIYGSDAELIRCIQLPIDIAIYAVETSIGKFSILQEWMEKEEEDQKEEWKEKEWLEGIKKKSGSIERSKVMKWVVTDLTKDGQMVIRRFISSNETQELDEPRYLSLDSDDRVFVANRKNHRVILLDSNPKWNRNLCTTQEGTRIRWPCRLFKNEEKKQLIVGAFLESKLDQLFIPRHAVETSIGNFVILHLWTETEEEGWRGPSGRWGKWVWGITELTRDGQVIVRSFIPSNETQKLNEPRYLSLDSDDQVLVADTGNNRVILLDYNLKWNRILCSTKEGKAETKIRLPWRLCYDEEMKQLIVAGPFNDGVNIYTLSRN